ncbi:MAG: deoxyribodipyrimidine photo-lyase [Cyclobacteriaceae bacterium]
MNIVIDKNITLFWFRRDLRLNDNIALFYALKENKQVLPLFLFDPEILKKLEDQDDARVQFIHETLCTLKSELEKAGSSLLVVHNTPVKFFSSISPKSVYTNEDYEPYARERDTNVAQILAAKNAELKTYKDQVIFGKEDILKKDGTPYTVFTPYSKKWKAKLAPSDHKEYGINKYIENLIKTAPIPLPPLKGIGFSSTKIDFPSRVIKSSIIEHYNQDRNYPAKKGTTQLSIHLRFGTISIRKLVSIALKKNEIWLNELIWRDFYHMILWHFPNVNQAFKPAYDRIEWRNNPDEFQAWCDGKTGYPIVDAGMRELNTTGFMHNRVRMIVASFLVKHLLIDWRWGEAYFARKLLDFDLAANNGGWQWAAGSGCDAAPYFRVFNPYLQTEKFDPELTYIKKWIPELDTNQYPKPIVDHPFARERVLRTYKEALQNN